MAVEFTVNVPSLNKIKLSLIKLLIGIIGYLRAYDLLSVKDV